MKYKVRILLILSGCVFAYMLPYYILGSSAVFNVGDNLDSNVPWYTVVSKSADYWSISNEVKIEEFMGGSVLRNHMPGSLKMTTLCFRLFKNTIVAYLMNKTLVHLLGTIGMALLLMHFFKEKSFGYIESVVVIVISLSFAILPASVIFDGASFVIAPFVFWAMLKYLDTERKELLLILFILPFASALVMTNLFVLFYLFAASGYFAWQKRSLLPFAAFTAYLFGVFVFDHQMFLSLFADGIYQRDTREIPTWNLEAYWQQLNIAFTSNKYNHQASLQVFVSLLFLFLILFSRNLRTMLLPILVFATAIINVFLAFFWNLNLVNWLPESILKIIQRVDLTRFTTLNATFFWTALGLALLTLTLSKQKWRQYISVFAATISMIFVLRSSYGYRENLRIIAHNMPSSAYWEDNIVSIHDYYSKELFSSIKERINYSGEYTLSFGLQPGVATVNGLNTLDGYFPVYSKDYNDIFLNALRKEVDSNSIEFKKLAFWGNRCYLFSPSLNKNWKYKDYIITKDESDNIGTVELKVNFNDFKPKPKFILSTVLIENTYLNLVIKLDSKSYPYRVYVYETQ